MTDSKPTAPGESLTHVDAQGTARMVDVTPKAATHRTAVARGRVDMAAETATAIRQARLKKGDAVTVARLAGVMAAKRTADLIPLCHPLALTHVDVDIVVDNTGVDIQATARCTGQTGVEMEALTAVSVAALTIYDMAKAIDREMRITGVELVSKRGGKSGDWERS